MHRLRQLGQLMEKEKYFIRNFARSPVVNLYRESDL